MSKKTGHDKKKDILPVLDDVAGEVVRRFIQGEITVINHRGTRRQFDGMADAIAPDGRAYRSRAHRYGGGVKRRGRGKG